MIEIPLPTATELDRWRREHHVEVERTYWRGHADGPFSEVAYRCYGCSTDDYSASWPCPVVRLLALLATVGWPTPAPSDSAASDC